jgi:CheY-like chemotaxis protein
MRSVSIIGGPGGKSGPGNSTQSGPRQNHAVQRAAGSAPRHETLVRILDAGGQRGAWRTSWGSLPADLAQRLPLRVLAAEDNPTNVKVITLVMERLGYRIDVAVNGLEVLCRASRTTIRPDSHGRDSRNPSCVAEGQRPRIIALIGGVMPEEHKACLDAGVSEFLNKPGAACADSSARALSAHRTSSPATRHTTSAHGLNLGNKT